MEMEAARPLSVNLYGRFPRVANGASSATQVTSRFCTVVRMPSKEYMLVRVETSAGGVRYLGRYLPVLLRTQYPRRSNRRRFSAPNPRPRPHQLHLLCFLPMENTERYPTLQPGATSTDTFAPPRNPTNRNSETETP